MNKDPAFLFYSSDFLVGVSDLTMEERGQYITLICLQHQKGHLSKRNIDIAIPNVSQYVLDKFKIDEEGNYYNVRTEEEIEKRQRYLDSRQANGAKGGRPKKTTENHMLSKEKPYGKPTENHSENEIEIKIINTNIHNSIHNSTDSIGSIYNKCFNEFWEKYPKKVAKKYAFDCYVKIEMTEELHQMMLSAIEKQKKLPEWGDVRYIPHPSTWLNQRRWEDEVQEPETSFDADDFFETAVKRSEEKIKRGRVQI